MMKLIDMQPGTLVWVQGPRGGQALATIIEATRNRLKYQPLQGEGLGEIHRPRGDDEIDYVLPCTPQEAIDWLVAAYSGHQQKIAEYKRDIAAEERASERCHRALLKLRGQ